MPAKILIADDHEVVRQGIRTILKSRTEWEVCGESTNGKEAVAAATSNRLNSCRCCRDFVLRKVGRRSAS